MDSKIFQNPDIQPIVFEDVFLKEADDYEGENFETEENAYSIEENNLDYKGIHLLVLVHGF